jgi:hypothetical protein
VVYIEKHGPKETSQGLWEFVEAAIEKAMKNHKIKFVRTLAIRDP